jgi:hypothetical protein
VGTEYGAVTRRTGLGTVDDVEDGGFLTNEEEVHFELGELVRD